MIVINNDTPDIIEIHVQDPPPSQEVVCINLSPEAWPSIGPGESFTVPTHENGSYFILARFPGEKEGIYLGLLPPVGKYSLRIKTGEHLVITDAI